MRCIWEDESILGKDSNFLNRLEETRASDPTFLPSSAHASRRVSSGSVQVANRSCTIILGRPVVLPRSMYSSSNGPQPASPSLNESWAFQVQNISGESSRGSPTPSNNSRLSWSLS